MIQQERVDKLAKIALGLWGIKAQVDMMVEEMAELTVALCKLGRRTKSLTPRDDPINIHGELADVEIMLRQMRLIFGGDNVDREIPAKLDRLERKIKESVNVHGVAIIPDGQSPDQAYIRRIRTEPAGGE